MPDILDDVDFGRMSGAYLMVIQYSGIKNLPSDPSIEQWNLKWVVDEPDSVFNGVDVWENYLFFPKYKTQDEVEALPAKERANLLRRKNERNRRLATLGVAEEDYKDYDVTQLTGTKAWVTVTTNNTGRTRVTNVKLYSPEDDVADNSTTLDI